MSAPRLRRARWPLVGLLAILGVLLLLLLLLRDDVEPLPAAEQRDRPAQQVAPSPAVTVPGERQPVAEGAEVDPATVEHRATVEHQGAARIVAVDDNLRPVDGVEVWLASRGTYGDGYESSPQNLRGVTGADGVVEFGGLPEGKYIVHARHEMLVHSDRRRKQMQLDQPNAVLKVADAREDLTVYLSMPVVCGVALVGVPFFYDSFHMFDAGYHSPANGDGQWSCERIRKSLQDAFPGSRCCVQVRDFHPPASGVYGSCMVTAWAVGYEAFRRELQPIPLDSYLGPVLVEAWDLTPSDQFGSIRITVNEAGGIPVEGLQFTMGTPMASWRDDRPEVHFLRLMTGESVPIPVGIYDLECEGDFQSRHPALTRRNLQVKAGELIEVVIDSPISWSRCQLSFRGAGDDRPLKGGILTLTHLESGIRVSRLINHFDPPIGLWLPDGEYKVRAEAYSSNPDMIWRHEDEVVHVGGGSLEAPQLVAREMVLVKR